MINGAQINKLQNSAEMTNVLFENRTKSNRRQESFIDIDFCHKFFIECNVRNIDFALNFSQIFPKFILDF